MYFGIATIPLLMCLHHEQKHFMTCCVLWLTEYSCRSCFTKEVLSQSRGWGQEIENNENQTVLSLVQITLCSEITGRQSPISQCQIILQLPAVNQMQGQCHDMWSYSDWQHQLTMKREKREAAKWYVMAALKFTGLGIAEAKRWRAAACVTSSLQTVCWF